MGGESDLTRAGRTALTRGRRVGRRALLLGGGGVAALLGLSGGALLGPWPAARGLRHLTATEAAAARALADTLFSQEAGPRVDDLDFTARFDASVGLLHPETARLLKLGLRAMEYATLPGYFSRFSALPLPQRTAALRGWERGSYAWMAALTSFRFQVAMIYFESEEARAACGWGLGCTPAPSAG